MTVLAFIKSIEKRKGVNPEEGEHKYGNVKYADPVNKKYPLDTEEHIKAAWDYIHHEHNANEYNGASLATLQHAIESAAKEHGIHLEAPLKKSLIFSRRGSSLDTRRSNLGFTHDNPVVANGDRASHDFVNNNPHAITGMYKGVQIHISHIRALPGKRGEQDNLDQSKIDGMVPTMENGYHHGHVTVDVDHHGEATISDGNHRVAAASRAGITHIPTDINYHGGSEMKPGVFDPANHPSSMPPNPSQHRKIMATVRSRSA